MVERSPPAWIQLGNALVTVLESHGIPADASVLAKLLERHGRPIHRDNLAKALRGETRPHWTTIESILDVVGATALERRMVRRAWAPWADPTSTITPIDALGGSKEMNRGRSKEVVLWRYRIGDTDNDDICAELRETLTGPDGLKLATFGPGQTQEPIFDMDDLPQRDFQVDAMRMSGSPRRVPASLHLLGIEPAEHRYRLAVQFSGLEGNEIVRWKVKYRWPGLWWKLRETGHDEGRLRMNSLPGEPEVKRSTLVLVASRQTFPDIRLIPRRTVAEVNRSVEDTRVVLRWTEPHPMDMVFDVAATYQRDDSLRVKARVS